MIHCEHIVTVCRLPLDTEVVVLETGRAERRLKPQKGAKDVQKPKMKAAMLTGLILETPTASEAAMVAITRRMGCGEQVWRSQIDSKMVEGPDAVAMVMSGLILKRPRAPEAAMMAVVRATGLKYSAAMHRREHTSAHPDAHEEHDDWRQADQTFSDSPVWCVALP